MPSQMVMNDGYQYHFKFYTHAVPTKIEGAAALATKEGVLAFGEPTSDQPTSDCTTMGAGWSQAFEAMIAGMSRPVCNRVDGENYVYVSNFSASGVTHLFTVTYYVPHEDAATFTPDIAKLQAIFSSVRVSPQPQN